MSIILDKIKGFGYSLTSMFQEDKEDDISYLNPDSEEGKKLAAEMKPYVDRMNALEEKRKKEQKQYEARIRNLREGDVSEQEKSSKGQDTKINPSPVIVERQNTSKTRQRQNYQGRDGREE